MGLRLPPSLLHLHILLLLLCWCSTQFFPPLGESNKSIFRHASVSSSTHVSPLVGWSYFSISIAPEHLCATVVFDDTPPVLSASQSVKTTLRWPTWWLTWWPTWRCTWWPTWRWTRWPTRRPTWRPTKKEDKSSFFVLVWHVVAHSGWQGGRRGGRHGGRQKKKYFFLFLADMELDMVADKEVEAFYYW